MPPRRIKRSGSRPFVGRRVAVAYNRHQCLPRHPRRKGEHCFPIRDRPNSSSRVLAYCDEVWLEDVAFFTSTAGVSRIQRTGQRNVCCFVVGSVISPRSSKVVAKTGWSDIRLDVEEEGCFYTSKSGACVRTAKYARLRHRKIEAFGVTKGDSVHSARELNPAPPALRTFGPQRRTWRGDMGGLNYEPATLEATVAALRWVTESFPGVVVVDGTDDWNAPDYVRPELWVQRWQLRPLAWWHTGMSGQAHSGMVVTAAEYERLRVAYRDDFGCDPEAIPGLLPPEIRRNPCGCWRGEGLQIHR